MAWSRNRGIKLGRTAGAVSVKSVGRRNPIRAMLAAGLGALIIICGGCRREVHPLAPDPKPKITRAVLRFRAEELPFHYERGETGAAWPVETTGGGVGLLDYDGDGRLDIFFAQGGPLKPAPASAPLGRCLAA